MAISKKKTEKLNTTSQSALFDFLEKEMNAYFTPEKYKTGLLPLDEVLGGYLESASTIELSGESGCGKSTLVLHLLKNLAEQGIKSVYIDAEGSVKDSMIKGIGLTPYLSTKENKDNLFTVIRKSGYEDVEKLISAFLQSDCGYKVFVIDSLTALIGDIYLKLDEGRQATEGRVGFDAQMNSRLMKKLNALKTDYNCIFIIINQTRVDLSNPYGLVSFKSTGGQAAKYFPDVRLFMKVKEQLKEKRDLLIGDDIETVIGANCTIESLKSRQSDSKVAYPLTLYFGRGISNLAAFVNMLPKLRNKQGQPVYEEVTKMTFKLHLDSGEYQTTRGKNGLNELVVQNADEISAMCDAYVEKYFADKEAALVNANYDTDEDIIVEENTKTENYTADDSLDLEAE